ncbi:hypothetical protein ACFV0O_23385 [Kitasatospora sp. NPDC059577]|uniref:hypothetical protein n=1 Tax=Kitasatospora sp. NPDC059577 TaxID=3346873 RepID=UPI00368053B8
MTTTRPGVPGVVIASPVTSSRSSTTVRSAKASWTRTSSPGTGAPTSPASLEA